jgi:16S rRNA (adenine1518-N6/adenine1519-N6)-dimethyltransferase
MGKLKLPYANKDLGQHFLIDQKVIKAICSDFMNECEGVIEVGPGPGILTEELKSATCPFHVIEMDTRFEEYLTQFITKEQITFSDALKVELDHYLKERSLDQKKIWLVSNLPYNVSVPLTTKFITTPQIEYMTLMFQKEVALKIQMRGKKE